MNSIISWITEPFIYPFMQNALLTALVVAIICAVLSCYLILKGWALMGDAISHAVLPGIVLAYLAGLPLSVGAFGSGLFCSLSVGYLKENSRIKEDTVMGIVFSGMFAIGLVMFTKVETEQHLTHILFGNLLGVSTSELIQTLIVSAIILFVILLKRKDFLLYCFDPSHTRVIGASPRLLHYTLLILLALTIVTAMQVVGVILVVAMLISPGITAYMLTKRFDRMLIIATIISISTSIFGTIISFHIDGATGPCIILLQAALFLLVLIYTKLKMHQQS
ncbi:manganese/iron transport system permease protein [Bisgaardia hudsonensis]|uniref:Manganese/iron transport system permease protein n=1 Tax=Bisgaardia hudsonensis TaxID=109472 RepID=A0A4R2MW51_9PAST|nr:metal ABC transporter permease [Bisgaardia hudsonensis]QLB12906.1 iron ABC transporter permease [Bisgaardia hudsonensis]TCP11320.1 manganese/iron transport system permease protein [Bisgaardia hudsonensis]